jgi:EAL domain-containing protein (putative c-di-GMP-specific phosphodiesterase class I)
MPKVIKEMFTLKARGVCFSLNDFGTGYDFLATADCHAYQGDFFSKPLALQDFEHYVCKRTDTRAAAA